MIIITHNSDVSPIRQPTNEERISNLIKENRNLLKEITRLNHEKQLLYTSLLKMKVDIDNHFDKLGKVYFSDEFYEDE